MPDTEQPYALAFTGQALLPPEPFKETRDHPDAEVFLESYLYAVRNSDGYEESAAHQIGLRREHFMNPASMVQVKDKNGKEREKSIADINAYTHGAVLIPQIILASKFLNSAHRPKVKAGHSYGGRIMDAKCFERIDEPGNPYMNMVAARSLGIDAAIHEMPSVMLRVRAEMEKVVHFIEQQLKHIAHLSIPAAPKLVMVGCEEIHQSDLRGILMDEFGESAVDESPIAQTAHHTPLLKKAADMLRPSALAAQDAIVFPSPEETLYYSNVTAQPYGKAEYANDVTNHLIKPAQIRAMFENLLKRIEDLQKIVIIELPGRESLKPIIAMIARSLRRKIESFTISSQRDIPGALKFIGAA